MAAKDICEEINVEAVWKQKRLRSTQRHFSYESHDEPFSDALRRLEVGFFNVVVDAATSAITEVFYIGKCGKHVRGLDKFPKSCRWGAGRAMHYRHRTALWRALWLDSRELVWEIKNFPHLPSKTMSLLERITFMHDTDLSEIYPNVWTALRIALPLPVTVAQAERSFSKLKLIKSYLRSPMSQERLSGLAIISINLSIGEQISYDDIIDDFASRKARF